MTLLRQIQEAAVDPSTDISTLLRKCMILATRLGNEEFKKWVENELNGYKTSEELPEYRILSTGSYGKFSNGRVVWNNTRIPPTSLPKEFRDMATKSYLKGPISEYVSLINTEKQKHAQEKWPADLVAHLGDNILEGMSCLDAWKLIPRGSLVALVDTIKTRILSFVLEIEKQAPDAGEAPPNSPPLLQDKINQIVQTNFYGPVQNVATGSSNVIQGVEFIVVSGDLGSLKKYLESLGVEATDIKDLDDAIQADSESGGKPSFGKRVQSWMGEMIGKAASGAWKIGASAASSALGKALSSYFGLD